MKFFICLIILIFVIIALGDEKDLRVVCYTDQGELIFDVPENEFHKMESGSMPTYYECEVYDASMELM